MSRSTRNFSRGLDRLDPLKVFARSGHMTVAQRLPTVTTESLASGFGHIAGTRAIHRQLGMAASIGDASDAAAYQAEFTCLNGCCTKQLVDGANPDPPTKGCPHNMRSRDAF